MVKQLKLISQYVINHQLANDPPEIEKKMERAWNVPTTNMLTILYLVRQKKGMMFIKVIRKEFGLDGSGFWMDYIGRRTVWVH